MQDVGWFAGGEGVAVEADVGRGGELGVDVGFIEEIDGVEAGRGLLVGVREVRAVAGGGGVAGLERDGSGDGLDEEVAEVGVAGAGEVSVRKAEDDGVLVAVAGGPLVGMLEVVDLRVGRELHHAEGHGGAGKGVAVGAGADEGVDEREPGVGRLLRGQRECKGEKNEGGSHECVSQCMG